MFSSILRFFVGAVRAKNFSPLRFVPWVLCVAFVLLALFFAVQSHTQALRLSAARADARAEQSAHNATRSELAQARADIHALNAALEASEQSTAAVQGNLLAALAREADAVRAAVARKKILDAMRTRPRTETEKQEVVDDETRRAAADRLNRPL